MRSSSPILAVCLLVSFSYATGQNGHPAPDENPGPAIENKDAASSTVSPIRSERPDVTPDAQGKLSQDQMQNLLRVVADKDVENDKLQRNYTYIEREVQNNLDGGGNKKSTEIKTFEILE